MKKQIIPGILVGFLIVLFLSGKIISIPYGTQEGGIISAVGVLVILMVSVIANHVLVKLKKSKEEK